MPAIRGVGFLGRTRERHRLDDMLAQARDGQSAVAGDPWRAGHRKDRAAALRRAAGLGPAHRRGRRRPGGDGAAVRRDPTVVRADARRGSTSSPNRSRTRFESPWASRRAMLRTGSWSPSPCSTCSAAIAEERPLLCLVDDAQWLDAASVLALGFVARRLLAEPVAMIFALREPITTRALDGLPRAVARRPRGAGCARSAVDAPCRAGSTTGSATGSSPRPGAIRWRWWSCRRG